MTAPTTSAERLKAYRVTVRDDSRSGGVYLAETASKARYDALLSARDAGYDVGFGDMTVRRAPEFDRLQRRASGWTPEYAERIMREEEAVERWNAAHPVGTPVRVRLDSGRVAETVTRSAAVILSDHASIWLKGIVGSYALSHVEPITQTDGEG